MHSYLLCNSRYIATTTNTKLQYQIAKLNLIWRERERERENILKIRHLSSIINIFRSHLINILEFEIVIFGPYSWIGDCFTYMCNSSGYCYHHKYQIANLSLICINLVDKQPPHSPPHLVSYITL